MLHVKKQKVLRKLQDVFDLEDVKYEVFSMTFTFIPKDGDVDKSITMDTLLNRLDSNLEVYEILNELRSSYFPRRLKENISGFYKAHGIKKPLHLEIGFEGFILDVGGTIHYVEYQDNFEDFLREFAKVYDVEYTDFIVEPDPHDYEGHYHK